MKLTKYKREDRQRRALKRLLGREEQLFHLQTRWDQEHWGTPYPNEWRKAALVVKTDIENLMGKGVTW